MDVGRAGWTLGCLFIVAGCAGGGDAASPSTSEPTESTERTAATTTVAAETTTVPPPTTEPEAVCVVVVAAGNSLSGITDDLDGVTVDDLLAENRLGDDHVIHPGDELDVCIGNDIDDVTGASRLPPGPAAVRRQQERLNELFAPYTIADLAVDGDSGPLTRQMLCAARMGLGVRVDASDMSEDSPEEETLFAAESLQIPDGAATWAGRWILIDKTCQVIFTGEGTDRIVDIFPTSTGEEGFETRDVAGTRAFRFDPALDNDGWHDSSRFPVEGDNPLNGNMYKPIYFSDGQAIHGAGYVPPEPRSKGCARTFPWHQDKILAWLGIDDLTEATWNPGQIGVTVTSQGDYRPVD